MQHRSCLGLLAVALVFQPAGLEAQSPRFRSAPDSESSLKHHIRAPIRGPLLGLPERSSPGDPGLTQLTRAAGMIFSGTVTGVTRGRADARSSLATVAITFRVDNAMRGAFSGQSLTITEWIGLWSSGQRYRVGERVLLFLYPRSKLGLTSPVGASLGRFRVDGAGRVLFSSQQLTAFVQDPVLGGRSQIRLSDFASAVKRASEEE